MELFLVYFFAIVNILSFFYYIRKYGRRLSPGILLLGFYVLIACIAIPAYSELPKSDEFGDYKFSNITLLPYVVYFVAMWLLLKPTFNFHKVVNLGALNFSQRKIELFSYFYIICSLITIYLMYRTITSNSVLENLAQVRNDLYRGESVNFYNNQFEHIFVSFTMYFQLPATLIFFILLSCPSRRINSFFLVLLAISLVGPVFLDAIRTASRGMVVTLFFRFLICYSLFSSYFSYKLKRSFLIGGGAILVLLLLYALIVTYARFGEGDSGMTSIICYWGQPTLVFNSQVMDIENYTYGAIFFQPIYGLLNINMSRLIEQTCSGFGSCFTTAIGTFYLDFGLVGLLILVILVPSIINKIIYKSGGLNISKLYIMLFYCTIIQSGALTIKWGFVIDVLVCFILYHILKYLTVSKSNI